MPARAAGSDVQMDQDHPPASILDADLTRVTADPHLDLNELREELIAKRPRTLSRLDKLSIDFPGFVFKTLQSALADDQNPADDESQAFILHCLEIVQAVIQHVPQTLVENIAAEHLDDGVAVPLYAWLVFRLIDLRYKVQLVSIAEKIGEILGVAVNAQYDPSTLVFSRFSLSTLLGAIATDILSSLEALDFSNAQPVAIRLCFQNPDLEDVVKSLGLPYNMFRNKMQIGTFFQALGLLFDLVALMVPSIEGTTRNMAIAQVRRDATWALEIYSRLWECVSEWINASEERFDATLIDVVARFFQDVLKSIQNLSKLPKLGSFDSGPATLLLHSLNGLLDCDHLRQHLVTSEEVVAAIVESIGTLKILGKKIPALEMDIWETLVPKLTEITRDDNSPWMELEAFEATATDFLAELNSSSAQEGPARKKLRLSLPLEEHLEVDPVRRLLARAFALLGSHEIGSFNDLHGLAVNGFASLSEAKQREFFQIIGNIPCAAVCSSPERISAAKEVDLVYCRNCDTDRVTGRPELPWHSTGVNEVRRILADLVMATPQHSQVRAAAIGAVRRLFCHEPDSAALQPTAPILGEVILQALSSPLRELRLIASNAVACFFRSSIRKDIRRSNYQYILSYLDKITPKSNIPAQETCLLTLCKLAAEAEEEALPFIFLRIIEFFGHKNPYICTVAYIELSKLAQQRSTTVLGLLRPFWRSIAIPMVKDIVPRPHMADRLADLMGLSAEDLLQLTESYTLGYFIRNGEKEIVEKIAKSHHKDKSAFDLCMERKNLGPILAYLLSQPMSDPETTIQGLLTHVDPSFGEISIDELFKTEPIAVAVELLKALADAGDNTQRAAALHNALHLLATFVPPRRSGLDAAKTPPSELIACFIEEYTLGLVSEFVNTISDATIRHPLLEKKRSLAAIGEMIKLARDQIRSALPQICGCVRYALDIEALCDQAIVVWHTLITSLSEQDVKPLVDQAIASILQYWPRFQEGGKQAAIELVDYFLQRFGDQLTDILNTLPSLLDISEMFQFEDRIRDVSWQMDVSERMLAFSTRLQSESAVVAEQALLELVRFLRSNEDMIHRSSTEEQLNNSIAALTRSLLDCCVKFNGDADAIPVLCAQSLGLIGCLDPNRVEAVREKRDIIVLWNFHNKPETFEFVLFFLQHVLVDAFLSASNTRAQGFLAFAMQALMHSIEITPDITKPSAEIDKNDRHMRWMRLPETIRNVLTPFLTSRYTVTSGAVQTRCTYPLFQPTMTHGVWLRRITLDLLQRANSPNVKLVFGVCSRIIRGQDLSIASYLFPFAVVNIALEGTDQERTEVSQELLRVLSHPVPDGDGQVRENILSCSESVFNCLDYLSRWVHARKKHHTSLVQSSGRHGEQDAAIERSLAHIRYVEGILNSIPPEIISKRAVECKSYSRALFNWEQYIRQQKSRLGSSEHPNLEPLYQRLQDIYMQIDEPDGIEGISAQLHILDVDQHVIEYRKTGRWQAAQSWYELQLNEDPANVDAQLNLLTCLRDSGQNDALITQFDSFKESGAPMSRLLPHAVEASIMTAKWSKLDEYLRVCTQEGADDFTISVGVALRALRSGREDEFRNIVDKLRRTTAKSLTTSSTTSLQSCHDSLFRFHALTELETVVEASKAMGAERTRLLESLDRRLDALGVYISEKQYLLGLRRATMELCKFDESEIAPVFLTSARLAQKNGQIGQAYQSVLHAAQLRDKSATIEQARLLWKDGYHRKAIETIKGAIAANVFVSHDNGAADVTDSMSVSSKNQNQNMLAARAHLLLAKWTDRAGQTQSDVIVQRYREAIKLHNRWEKAHYYLGKHYNKILEYEKSKPFGKEAQTYLSGETAKLVIENFLRSLANGNKYVFQTLPKILTLWLEHASSVNEPLDPKRGDNVEFQNHTMAQRKKILNEMHNQLKKYISRMPNALLFTILPQVVARINHPNADVCDILTRIVVKTVTAFPQQGLWTVLALVKSSSRDRATRGVNCLQRIVEQTKKAKGDSTMGAEIRALINHGQRFSDELLGICRGNIEEKATKISLSRNLGFNHRVAPCGLAVPFQAMLTPSLPASHDPDYLKGFKAFPRDTITIEKIQDEALVLSSLQKPRRITIRGSDGQTYHLLCKPNDDLRKDQRLMEFNNIVNRFFKKDVESTKRQLYVKTYAVTPLNEDCGVIEWVDNLRPLRDVVIRLLRERGIVPNYREVKSYLDEACSDVSKLHLFDKVLSKLPPVLYEWFIETYPDPGSWFAARLRYTRTTAVMSMVGYVLGLGDRHGENILFEEGTGGILHVDFNCLFDKGLTFDKPELVPFRLTHNMIDAFGAYGYNGPFRRTCEITLGLLRQNEDALMTILETFLYDPTTDFIGKKTQKKHPNVPDTPAGVLEAVRNKLRGLLPGESVPLAVDGHVDELIVQATDKKNLAAMYIGWCAFF